MNDKTKRLIVAVAGQVGSPLFALSVFVFWGDLGFWRLLFPSFLAGTAGHFVFMALATLCLKAVGHGARGLPGMAVYGFGELPMAEEGAAGGKGRSLARLKQEGFPVPDGFILMPSAFSGDELKSEAWEKAQPQLARLRHGRETPRFAVRSSSVEEDSARASFAGEFETVLNVDSDRGLRDAIGQVRRSRHSARVRSYIEAQGLTDCGGEIAVVVQLMVRADFSGVLFTVDPLGGDLTKMTGNFVSGLGEKLVSGDVSASAFTFGRPAGSYHGPSELSKIAPALYLQANDIEKQFGCPQDIEWAVSGGRLSILQARPITTLSGYDPKSGEWNDTLKGNFLWSANNLIEACPEILSPFSASLRPYLEKMGGPALTVKSYPLNGIIGGRFYSNLSVQISAFLPLFKGDARRAYKQMALAGWWGEIPEGMEIPTIPLSKKEWFSDVLPVLIRTNAQFKKYRKLAAEYIARSPEKCAALKVKIGRAGTKAELATLWREEISPLYRDSVYHIIAASSDAQFRLEAELRSLVGAEDANALMSNLSGEASRLQSLGPLLGLEKVLRGEMEGQNYLEAYGHRGQNECECAWPRPAEDPAWLDRQLAEHAKARISAEELLSRQRASFKAAWLRLKAKQPKKASAMGRRIEKVGLGAQRRELSRSEGVRVVGVVRAFALRAGDMLGRGESIFFLTIDEVLEALGGGTSAFGLVPGREATFRAYHALPLYPPIICGRFEPLAWAKDRDRRGEFGREKPTASIVGFAGALGVVEGTVRILDSLDDSGQFQQGEVLVTKLTNIGWTSLFPIAAAIVTDLGAPLSHAAIVARELGIPAVVGCGDATARLKTGDRVRVDGGAGTVEILGKEA